MLRIVLTGFIRWKQLVFSLFLSHVIFLAKIMQSTWTSLGDIEQERTPDPANYSKHKAFLAITTIDVLLSLAACGCIAFTTVFNCNQGAFGCIKLVGFHLLLII